MGLTAPQSEKVYCKGLYHGRSAAYLVAPMYFVYIIETEDGTYYTGMTNDIVRRFQEHLAGNAKSAAYLKMHKPKYVVYMAECRTRGDAMRLERRLKNDYRFKLECVGPRRDIREVIDSELSYR